MGVHPFCFLCVFGLLFVCSCVGDEKVVSDEIIENGNTNEILDSVPGGRANHKGVQGGVPFPSCFEVKVA